MKRDDVKGHIIFFVLLLVPVVWAALLAAPFLSGGLPKILKNLLNAMNSPLDIHWVKETPKSILLFLGTYGLGIGIYLSTRRNYRPREEHGCSTIIKTVGLRQRKVRYRKRGGQASLSANCWYCLVLFTSS